MLCHIVWHNLLKLGIFIHIYIVHIRTISLLGLTILELWHFQYGCIGPKNRFCSVKEAKKQKKMKFFCPVRHKDFKLYSRFQFEISNGLVRTQETINLRHFWFWCLVEPRHRNLKVPPFMLTQLILSQFGPKSGHYWPSEGKKCQNGIKSTNISKVKVDALPHRST